MSRRLDEEILKEVALYLGEEFEELRQGTENMTAVMSETHSSMRAEQSETLRVIREESETSLARFETQAQDVRKRVVETVITTAREVSRAESEAAGEKVLERLSEALSVELRDRFQTAQEWLEMSAQEFHKARKAHEAAFAAGRASLRELGWKLAGVLALTCWVFGMLGVLSVLWVAPEWFLDDVEKRRLALGRAVCERQPDYVDCLVEGR